jgi:hypothetical protein
MTEDLEEDNEWLNKHLAMAIAALGNHLARIEQLETALREIAFARPECCVITDAMQSIARKALAGEE